MDQSVTVSVGEPVRVKGGIQVTVDCGPLIDQANEQGFVPNITWYREGYPITNRTDPLAVLSPDERFCIIYIPLQFAIHIGNHFMWTCEVCEGITNCVRNETAVTICGE